MSEPATKQDLDEAMGVLRDEMKATTAELHGEMTAMEARLRSDLGGDMKAMEARLRSDLGGDMKAMEARLRSDLGNDMKAMETRLRSDIGNDMKAMEARLSDELSRAANAMMEHVSRQFAVLDDKYGALPPRHDALRSDFDTHVADLSLQARRPMAPAKRTRRSRSR